MLERAADGIDSDRARCENPLMSYAIVRAEIERFLRSPSPEVLCISGRWGVGKTYSWQTFLREEETAGRLGVDRHAYVSLFGLNSLGELRSAIVENTVVAGRSSLPDASSLHGMLREGERFARRSRPALEVAAGFFRMKDAGDALYRAAFLTVQGQLVCFDDLERAGKSLEMRDVLGLASLLREQRGCKVVLLLNKEQAEAKQAEELDRQLEKVVDTFLIFEPTSAEAAAIAIGGDDPVAVALRDRLVALDVTNMRVMKKVERWARLVETELRGFDAATLAQATATVVLGGWCFLQRDLAPSLDFVRGFNPMSGLFGRKEEPADEKGWRELLGRYGYGSTDELDEPILDGVALGYFRGNVLREAARSVEERRRREGRDDSFSRAWRLYHDSLTTDDDVILDAMQAGALENLAEITPTNMNGTLSFLRRYGRDAQASDILARWIEANRGKEGFFDRWNRFFANDPVDAELLAAMEAGRAEIVDARDPADMLKQMAKSGGYNPAEDAARLSRLSADEIVRLFDDHAADDVKGMMEWADRLAAQPGAENLRASLDEALGRIASRSRMREDRLRGWGVLPKSPEDGQAQPPEGVETQNPASAGADAAAAGSASATGYEHGGSG
ncbi:hypothetical protein SAMN05192580_3236 [Sphingomonas jatrophae]|uniref:KAP family P-loop domain-containing protein n=2 Tax=Sphingomonas jatrophae TaxID=1166337 RepID=A0A1I6M0L4_9SPHN|nr:hypothetical protein SAMN05192580_3236 [Sphingomonas jatrophae]